MGRVVDDYGLIGPAGCARLQAAIDDHERTIDAELLVMALPSVARRAFRDHAVAMRRNLSLRRDRSVILVVATAPGLAGRFDGRTTGQMLQTEVVPLLRAGELEAALCAGLAAISRRIRESPSPAASDAPRGLSWPARVAIGVAVAVALGFIVHRVASRDPNHGDPGYGIFDSDGGSGSSTDGGSGSSDGGSTDGGGGADY